MRRPLAALAALTCALLFTACSSNDDADTSASSPAAASSPASEAGGATGDGTVDHSNDPQTKVSAATTCGGFYGNGEYSVATLVEQTTPVLDEAAAEENAAAIAATRQRIDTVRGLADGDLAATLEQIETPFQQAVDGVDVETGDLAGALDTLRQQCTDAGYAFEG